MSTVDFSLILKIEPPTRYRAKTTAFVHRTAECGCGEAWATQFL